MSKNMKVELHQLRNKLKYARALIAGIVDYRTSFLLLDTLIAQINAEKSALGLEVPLYWLPESQVADKETYHERALHDMDEKIVRLLAQLPEVEDGL